jgi:putative flippase GtrA
MNLPSRFLRFGAVGFSGVLVNLATLWVLADGIGVHTNVAAALAIETSVLSNFALNDRWTFGDRAGAGRPWWVRLLRFHAVSGVGAAIQWTAFVALNALVAAMVLEQPVGPLRELIDRPPEVGALKYASQLAAIGIAAVWNFLANLLWTWRRRPSASDLGAEDR